MSVAIANIFKQTQELSLDERSELIKGLIREVDLTLDESTEEAWLKEAKRRHKEIKSGKRKTITYEELKQKLNWV